MSEDSSRSSVKQMARELGLSMGTVSIVLNGRGNEMRISKATQKRVMECAKKYHYRPNVYAKRLRRAGGKSMLVVAVFWPSSFNPIMVSRFLNGLQRTQDKESQEVEIMLQPYRYNELYKSAERLSSGYYSGAVLMGLSEKDFSFVNSCSFDIPIVLLNRVSDKYSAVCVDDFENGARAAELLIQRGHKELGLISYSMISRSSMLRQSGFLSTSMQNGIYLTRERIVDAPTTTYDGGKIATEELLQKCAEKLPTGLFIQESSLAMGALLVFKKHGIEVPNDMEIITYGDNPQDAFTIPTLTSIRMPIEEMSSECIKLITDILSGHVKKNTTSIYPTSLVFRESCGNNQSSFKG